jgi:cyclopropane-fatty-acyl-phospholipid synthase
MMSGLLFSWVRSGRLSVIDPDGTSRDFGDGMGCEVVIRFHDAQAIRRVLLHPRLALGEAYMDGTLTVERGDIYQLIELLDRNLSGPLPPMISMADRLGAVTKRLRPTNKRAQSHANVAHHYDLSGALYELFLDKQRFYSCALFGSETETLEQAQARKVRHLIAKLHVADGQSILDIGSGWGGLALALARVADVRVLGITLSAEQLAFARKAAIEAGLNDRVTFELMDYRDVQGAFDRVISVGMFEHVGVEHYNAFFNRIAALLTPAGEALVHAIGRSDGPGDTNIWLRKYIFPGGYSPALSEVLPAVERSCLFINDIEVLHLHYARTLHEWRRRFMANRAAAIALYDERFCRMWEFYLAGCEMAFRTQGHMVWQMQICRDVARPMVSRAEEVDAERALERWAD